MLMHYNTFSKLAALATLCSSMLIFEIALAAQDPSPEASYASMLKTKVEPKYTEQAFQAGLTGKVILLVKVDRNGIPTQVRFLKWSGRNGDKPLGLDKAAIEAVRQWRFSPGVKWGKAVPVSASIEVEFDFHQHPEQRPTQPPQPSDRPVRI